MKIVLASDCHGQEASIKKIFLREQDADSYLFLGDSCLYPQSLSPFASVKGNNDFGLDYPKTLSVNTPAGLLYACHYPIRSKKEVEDLIEKGVRIYAHGHTHRRFYEDDGKLAIVCPGSTDYPRDGQPGYCVLMIDKAGKIACTFKDL